jgi:SnoaL-like domain
MAVAPTAIDIAEELIDALAAQDFERVERCLAPDVAFHAVVPGTGSFRDRAGAQEAAKQLRTWFGDADPLELLEHSVEPVVDKLRLSYRFAAFEDEQWHIVEQQAYAVVGERGIAKLDLVCSGFRPVLERPAPL